MSVIDILLIVVTVLGILNTVYLTYCCITGTDVKCLFLPEQMCLTVQNSSYSRTFGIPNPYLGLGMLSFILMLLVAHWAAAIPFWPVAIVITGGFLFSMYFLYIQKYVLKAFCTWCVVSAIVFTLLFILSTIKFLA